MFKKSQIVDQIKENNISGETIRFQIISNKEM